MKLLEEWRKDLAAAKTRVREKEIAIYTLEQSIKGKSGSSGNVPVHQSKIGQVRDFVRDMEGEFSIASVHDAMVRDGVIFTAAKPKMTIFKAFEGMLKKGQIELTFKGSGSVPHRYKRTSVEINSDEGEDEA